MKTVALVPGSFSPPTKAHLELIKFYADKANQVIVLISNPKKNSKRKSIVSAEASKEIFETYLKAAQLLDKVVVKVSAFPSPIQAAVEYIGKANDEQIIVGVSKKDNDFKRYEGLEDYFDASQLVDQNVNILSIRDNAFDCCKDVAGVISATQMRNSIGNNEKLLRFLPKELNAIQIDKVISILNGKPLSEVAESLDPVYEDECVSIDMPSFLEDGEVSINAYSVDQTAKDEDGKPIPYNPKKFPEEAVVVMIEKDIGRDNLKVRIHLDPESKAWDSDVIVNGRGNGKLSPEQMGDFFDSDLYDQIIIKLRDSWPLTDDSYASLYDALLQKQMCIDNIPFTRFDDEELAEDGTRATDGHIEHRDKANKDTDNDGKRDYTASGRRIVSFSDFAVSKKGALFYCWPKRGDEFKWSQWRDWEKIRPLAKMIFQHGKYDYMLSIGTFDKGFDNRGWRGADYSWEPPIGWTTVEETTEMLNLSLVKRFIKQCIERIKDYVSMDDEEIFKKINAPEKCTMEEIRKTKSVIKKVLQTAFINPKADTFKFY